jgi:hypothetical protein
MVFDWFQRKVVSAASEAQPAQASPDAGVLDVVKDSPAAAAAASTQDSTAEPKAAAAEIAKELFEVGEGERLRLGDLTEGDPPSLAAILLAGGELDHGHDGVAAAGG